MNKEMKKMKKPRLRFAEFQADEGWTETRLGELGELVSGLTYSPDDVRDKGLLVLRSSNIQNGEIALDDCVYVTTDIKGANLSRPNDILICVRNGSKNLIGKNALIPEGLPLCTHGAFMTVFRSKSPDFVFQLFKTDSYNEQVSADLGATINSINGSQFVKYKFYVPKPNEQQKIAACLTSLDDLISAEGERLKALQAHKKGLMQQLFPAEGETVPRVRFGEFEGEWETTTIEDNCILKGRIGFRGYTKEDLVKKGQGALVLGGKHIQNQRLDLSDPTYLSWEKYYESPEIMVEANHIIFSQRGSLGDCALIEGEIGKATINPSMVLLKDITCNPKFLYYTLIGNQIQKEVRRISASSAVPMLSQGQIKEFPFLIPSIQEQQKIASCLSTLDDLIAAQGQKLEGLRRWKKGLMQQLFPNPIQLGQ